MINKIKKHAFTLVELLVVIAILAILATVSIIGYSTFIEKANLSNDQAMITQMNITLKADAVLNEYNYAGDAIVGLNRNGFDGKYNAYTTGYHYGYHKESNTMYLIDKNNNVVYPNDTMALTNLWVLYDNTAIAKVGNANKYVCLTNVTNENYYLTHFNDGGNYTLDLAGHYINSATDVSAVTVINGVIVSGASSGEDVVQMESIQNNQIISGTSEQTNQLVNKVFDNSNTEKLRSTKYVEYKDCIFYGVESINQGYITNVIYDGCTFIDCPNNYIFNIQGLDNSTGTTQYGGHLVVKNCNFINCGRVFNICLGVHGRTTEELGSVTITGNTFNAVTGQDRAAIQINIQKRSEHENDPIGYIDYTITNNTFAEVATTQAGLLLIHESIIEGESNTQSLSADHIIFSNNIIDSSIPSSKYVVNDDGKADDTFDPYCEAAAQFKTDLTNKVIAGKK